MKRHVVEIGLVLGLVCSAFAEQMVVEHVKIRRHRSEEKRVLVDKVGVLTFDDAAHKLLFKDEAGDNIDVGYDDVVKVVFEVTTHMRGGALSQIIGGIPGAIIAGKHVNDYWMYVEYAKAGGVEPFLMEIQKESSDRVIEKARAVFDGRATVTEFSEKGAEINKELLRDLQSKHDFKLNKENHPLPELKPDKALVVVVCPALAARYTGQGNQFKLHANDRVIAVNKMGTYSFAYLDPGKYMLVSQSENADGFEMQLEAGKDYYFLQNTFQGSWKAQTALSRNTKELVMYELNGAFLSDWKRKGGEAKESPGQAK
ncbi:MAG: hypothetical protein WAQ52_17735 [Terriglobales bacterium]